MGIKQTKTHSDMKNILRIFTIAVICAAASQNAGAQKVSDLKFYDVKSLIRNGSAMMIGQATDKTSDTCFYYRLPDRLEGVVRKELWDLGKDGAGIAVRFSTDSRCIGARWTLTSNFGMAHMAYTGIKGMDLYVLDVRRNIGAESAVTSPREQQISEEDRSAGRRVLDAVSTFGQNVSDRIAGVIEGKVWKFAGTAFPNGKNSASVFVRKMAGGQREYMIYLPLYDGIESLEIGIDSSANIYAPSGPLVPEYRRYCASGKDRPIVFYGTSVTQGGCASRPGMAYPSIISRALNVETVNLGFSGNGRMDANMADFIAGIPASAYVIDCLANCTYETTRDSSAYFISRIAAAHPETPVYMVNNYRYPQQFILPENNDDMTKENGLWKSIFKELSTVGTVLDGKATGPLKNLRYIDVSSENVIGNEDTVDGTHLTDLGFTHLAKEIMRYLK